MLTVLTVGVVKGVDVAVLAVDTDTVVSDVVTGVLAVVCDSVVNVVGVVVLSVRKTEHDSWYSSKSRAVVRQFGEVLILTFARKR